MVQEKTTALIIRTQTKDGRWEHIGKLEGNLEERDPTDVQLDAHALALLPSTTAGTSV